MRKPLARHRQCLSQTIGGMGPQTQTSQKQKAQPHLGFRPGTHPMNGHQWGVVVRDSLLVPSSFGGREPLFEGGQEGIMMQQLDV